MPRLSIVISSAQGGAHFETTLASVLQNRPDDCEVLVVQPCRYDDPYQLGGEVRFVEAPAWSREVDLINVGLQCAIGEVVHVLRCDVEVEEGWADAALEHFANASVASVAPALSLRSDPVVAPVLGVGYSAGGRSWLIRCAGRAARDRSGVLGPTLAAGFYRRQSVLEVGGFCAALGTELAAVDMALALHTVGWAAASDDRIRLRARRLPDGTGLSYAAGRQAERLFWRNARPSGWTWTLLVHVCVIASELVGNFLRPAAWAMLLGRLAGWPACLNAAHRQHTLAQLRGNPVSPPVPEPDHKLRSLLSRRAA